MSNIHPQSAPLMAADAAPRFGSNYPAPFAARMNGRTKRVLGDLFGLRAIGVNLTTLAPGAVSALHHAHSWQDEFVYVLRGEPTVVIGESEYGLKAGMCVGFRAGGPPHHLYNPAEDDAVYLEIGDRTPGDQVTYPLDDLKAEKTPDGWSFTHKDGQPW